MRSRFPTLPLPLFSALLSTLLWAPSQAAAQLTDLGDRTLDEATGLLWLDVTETTNLSYEAIVGGAGGWTAQGWRHATLAEVCQLFTSYAIAPASPCGTGNASQPGDGVRDLQALLGITRVLGTQQEDTFGFVDNGTPGPSVGRGLLIYSLQGSSSTAGVEATSVFGRSDALTTHGHFLVRTNPAAGAVTVEYEITAGAFHHHLNLSPLTPILGNLKASFPALGLDTPIEGPAVLHSLVFYGYGGLHYAPPCGILGGLLGSLRDPLAGTFMGVGVFSNVSAAVFDVQTFAHYTGFGNCPLSSATTRGSFYTSRPAGAISGRALDPAAASISGTVFGTSLSPSAPWLQFVGREVDRTFVPEPTRAWLLRSGLVFLAAAAAHRKRRRRGQARSR